jgi:hypothetical protein
MIADICWDAPSIYAVPNASDRYTAWWSREYFGASPATHDAATAYTRYFALLDKPDTLWTAMDAIQNLIDRLYQKVAGAQPPPFAADTAAQLRSRAKSLDEALAVEERAENALPPAQRRFLSIDAGLGLRIAQRQTHAALTLADALQAPGLDRTWQLVRDARTWLELLETDFARAEYPPFDRWYHESWIRSAGSLNNPHRAYDQVRDFIGTDGHDQRPRASEPGLPPAAR